MTRRHPIFARCYPRLSALMDRQGAVGHRQRLLAGLAGEVLELGAGPGGNFPHYPLAVQRVVAVEPEPHLRAVAQEAALRAPVPVEVRPGDAADLPAGDGVFDAAVASLVLCSVPDQATALAQLRRVLRPGGELRFYEHVRAEQPRHARAQRVVDRLWPYLAAGCHTARDTLGAIEAAGFVVEERERFTFPPSRVFQPASPHVLGRARAPGDG